MNKTCKPVQRKGERNVLCVHYCECLDFVIKNSWKSWDCSDCPHMFNREGRPEMRLTTNEEVAYYDLSPEWRK